MKKVEIYNNREKQKAAVLKKLHESNISEADKKLILEFVNYKTEEDRIGIIRQNKYLMHLRILAEHLKKPFDNATKEDIKKLLNEMYSMNVKRGETVKKISESSKADYTIILKTFYKWLKGTEKPEETAWIKPISVKKKRLRPDEIIQWEDAVLLSKSAMNPRDMAFPQVLWECGGRIGEILTLKICDVEFVNSGDALVLHLRESKTELRAIVIVKSAPALINWLENHPTRNNKDSQLWVKVTKPDKIMNYTTARKVLIDLKRRSGLDKPVNPHHFRKSGASHFSHLLTESETKKRYGWTQDSSMLQLYCFPDENRINEKIMQMEGITEKTPEEKQKENENLKPKRCAWCNKLNPVGQEYCVLCKRPLNSEQNLLQSQIKETIDTGILEFTEQHPEFINQYIEFMREKIK